MNALYRPGPMDNIPRYINCKHGVEQPEYLHPLLEPILQRDLRRHHLPGAGDADRPRARGLLARRRRSAAPRDGQEDQGRDGRPARGLHRGRDRARRSRRSSRPRSSSRSPSSPPTASPRRMPPPTRCSPIRPPICKANHPLEFFAAAMTMDRANQDRLNVYRQEIAQGRDRRCCRRTSTTATPTSRSRTARGRRDPLRAGGDPRRRRPGGRGRWSPSATGERPVRRPVRPRRPGRRAGAQPAPARGADQGGRARPAARQPAAGARRASISRCATARRTPSRRRAIRRACSAACWSSRSCPSRACRRSPTCRSSSVCSRSSRRSAAI